MPGAVKFLGHLGDRDRLADLFANVDVFIHPNPREPFGIASLEAMASGLPLVGPNAGGVTSYANDSNAWLSEPKPECFAGAVESVFAGRVAREQRVRVGLETSRRFEWRNMAAEFLQLYSELHSRTQGLPSATEPQFVSTLGNYFGQEKNHAV